MCGGSSMLWFFFFFSSRRRHTRCSRDWSSDVCSSDLLAWPGFVGGRREAGLPRDPFEWLLPRPRLARLDRKSTRLNSSHGYISYAVFCLKKKKNRLHSRPIVSNALPFVDLPDPSLDDQ